MTRPKKSSLLKSGLVFGLKGGLFFGVAFSAIALSVMLAVGGAKVFHQAAGYSIGTLLLFYFGAGVVLGIGYGAALPFLPSEDEATIAGFLVGFTAFAVGAPIFAPGKVKPLGAVALGILGGIFLAKPLGPKVWQRFRKQHGLPTEDWDEDDLDAEGP